MLEQRKLQSSLEQERENQKYKECGLFNVALDFVLLKDGTEFWEVDIEFEDNTSYNTTFEYETYEDALAEFNRWGSS